MVAFLLNIAAVFLVSAGSGLVLTLAGVFKDILLITGSVLIFGAQITPLQVIGGFITSIIARVNLNRFMMCRVLDRPRRPYPVQDRRQQVNTHDESCVWLVLGAWALITEMLDPVNGRMVALGFSRYIVVFALLCTSGLLYS